MITQFDIDFTDITEVFFCLMGETLLSNPQRCGAPFICSRNCVKTIESVVKETTSKTAVIQDPLKTKDGLKITRSRVWTKSSTKRSRKACCEYLEEAVSLKLKGIQLPTDVNEMKKEKKRGRDLWNGTSKDVDFVCSMPYTMD